MRVPVDRDMPRGVAVLVHEAGPARPNGVSSSTWRDLTTLDLTMLDLTMRDLTMRDLTMRDLTMRDLTMRDLTVLDLTMRDLTMRDLTMRDLTMRDLTVARPRGIAFGRSCRSDTRTNEADRIVSLST
jgi:hypothetical protein